MSVSIDLNNLGKAIKNAAVEAIKVEAKKEGLKVESKGSNDISISGDSVAKIEKFIDKLNK